MLSEERGSCENGDPGTETRTGVTDKGGSKTAEIAAKGRETGTDESAETEKSKRRDLGLKVRPKRSMASIPKIAF